MTPSPQNKNTTQTIHTQNPPEKNNNDKPQTKPHNHEKIQQYKSKFVNLKLKYLKTSDRLVSKVNSLQQEPVYDHQDQCIALRTSKQNTKTSLMP